MENVRGELRLSDQTDSIKGTGGKPGQGYQAAVDGMTVRRLTVTECERLQDFRDDYTLIPWPSKPREGQDRIETVAYLMSHGLPREDAEDLADTPDGHRYKGLGNSMARCVMVWIGTVPPPGGVIVMSSGVNVSGKMGFEKLTTNSARPRC